LGHFKDLVESHLALLFNAQKSITESEERFRCLVESSLTGISILKGKRVVYQNPEQSRLLGETPCDQGRPYMDFLHADDVEKVQRWHQDLLSGRIQTMDADFRIHSNDPATGSGPLRWIKCRAGLVPIDGGSALLTNMMDITRTKELEHLVRMEDKNEFPGPGRRRHYP
jgi:PAS domain S-box-containing protein